MKNQQRLQFLVRAVGPQKGTYVCTVPACRVKEKKDGFCPTHSVPLRLQKSVF